MSAQEILSRALVGLLNRGAAPPWYPGRTIALIFTAKEIST